MSEALLQVRGLKKHFPVRSGFVLARVTGWIKAVDGIDFAITAGETFALVGESGCGKTTTGKVILLQERPTAGSILFESQDIARLRGKELKRYRSAVQAVFQDPYSSLNPRLRVGSIIAEPLLVNDTHPYHGIKERVSELLTYVGIPPQAASLYPHEFSGGQRQRIAVARALALDPRLIVLDEPVSALDVSIRAQLMNLLKDLQEKLGVAYLLIAHHLATVRYMCHRVGVMYLGRMVEIAPGEELFTHPLHPYTQALLSAALPASLEMAREEIVLSGEVPSPINLPSGCRFHPRCFRVQPSCLEEEPELKPVAPDHLTACHLC